MSWALASTPGAHRLADRRLRRAHPRQIALGQRRRELRSAEPRELGAAQLRREVADDRDAVALGAEAEPPGARHVGELADHADDRRRVDRPLAALVVERHVAADDRDRERPAGVAEAAHRLGQLPGDVRLLGVAEVEAVGQAERLRADAREVRRALEHRLERAAVRVGGDAPAVAVDRERDPGGHTVARGQLEHRGVGVARDGARCATARSSRTARRAGVGRRCSASAAARAAPRRDPPRPSTRGGGG